MNIVKIPFVNALGKRGSEGSPELILKELGRVTCNVSGIEVDNSNVEESERAIYEGAGRVFKGKGRAVFIGGDHSISFPILRAFRDRFRDCFLVVFDAHADCMPCMREPTHEEWLRGVIESGFSPRDIVIVGLRKIEDEEARFLRESGVKWFSEIEDFEAATDYITERANGRDVYVSLDIDVVDPAYAPGVNYPEPAGLSSRELLYMLGRIFKVPGVRALDVVEVVSENDRRYDFRTVKLSAKIIQRFMGGKE